MIKQFRRLFFRSQKTKLFHELFFLVFLRKMDTNMASKIEKIMSKKNTWNEVEKTSTICVKSDAVRPVKNDFSIGRVLKNLKNQRCEQLRKYVKTWCQNTTEITEKWALELNKKRCLKTYPKNSENNQKWLQKCTPQDTLKHNKNTENLFQNLTKKRLQIGGRQLGVNQSFGAEGGVCGDPVKRHILRKA